MALSSHSRRGAVKPPSVCSLPHFRGCSGRLRRGGLRARLRTRDLGADAGVGDPPEQVCPSSQIVFSRVAREHLERDVSHIVMFPTWLLESPYECEIAHMVPRAGTLVPISESETKLTYQVPGFSQHGCCVIARGRLRGRTAGPRPSGVPLRLRNRPSEGLRGHPGRVA